MQVLIDTQELEQAKGSQSLLRLLIDSLPAFISYIDSEQRYALANALYASFFEQPLDQLVGRSVKEVLGGEAYEKVRYHIQAALNAERQSYEYQLPHAGKTRWLKSIYIPNIEKGKVKGIFVLGIDITEQKQAENAVRNGEERYRRLFENSPISLWEEDYSEIKKYLDDLRSEGIKDLRKHFIEHPENLSKCASAAKILDVNEATLVLYGAKSVDELRGELSRVFTPGSQDNFIDELIALSEGKTQFEGEFDNRTLTGEIKHISLTSTVIPGYEDTFGKVLISIIDLTERRRMEEKLAQTERLSAIGETAAMVGHDLRNPLQAISTALYLLQNLTAFTPEEDRKEALAMIKDMDEQVLYMNKIVSDLQNYSGPVASEPIHVDLTELLKGALSTVKFPPNVETALSVEGSRVFLDPILTKRIIINLVTNAIQAMPDGGKITITGVRGPTSLLVKVQDTGVGIAREDLERIFAPFFTKKAKGQGLGLAVCKRLVEAQDGTITVASELGQGTTFTLTIPMPKNSEAN